MTYRGGTDQGCNGEHEHAHPQGRGDVFSEVLEDEDDAGVVGSDTDAEQNSTDDLSKEAGPELCDEHGTCIDKKDDGCQNQIVVPEPVEDESKTNFPDKIKGSHNTEKNTGFLRTYSKLLLRSVSDEGIGCKNTCSKNVSKRWLSFLNSHQNASENEKSSTTTLALTSK